MALVVETGNVDLAGNSYVSVADARTRADSRGLTLDADDAVLEQQLLAAMDYLEARRTEFVGCKVQQDQPLQFPRQDYLYEGFTVEDPDDGDPWFMPKELVAAQVQLTHEIFVGTPLYPPTVVSYSGQTGSITKETIGPLTTEYSNSKVDRVQPNIEGRPAIIATVETLLRPLLKSVSGFTTVRV